MLHTQRAASLYETSKLRARMEAGENVDTESESQRINALPTAAPSVDRKKVRSILISNWKPPETTFGKPEKKISKKVKQSKRLEMSGELYPTIGFKKNKNPQSGVKETK